MAMLLPLFSGLTRVAKLWARAGSHLPLGGR